MCRSPSLSVKEHPPLSRNKEEKKEKEGEKKTIIKKGIKNGGEERGVGLKRRSEEK